MNIQRLFNVLVLGSALSGCTEAASPTDAGSTDGGEDAITSMDGSVADAASDTPTPDAAIADASPPDATTFDAGAADAVAAAAATGDLTNCGFCPNEMCCDEGETLPGFQCCWGTSC